MQNTNLSTPMRIGITERGDAGIDLSWTGRLDSVNGAILITKNLMDGFCRAVLDSKDHHPLIIHAGCTGWGGSALEPRVPRYHDQLGRLSKLITDGFPAKRCVLRIDPIIPTPAGLDAVRHVLNYAANDPNLAHLRVRISVLDEYKHVKERLTAKGYSPFYPNGAFQASPEQFDAVRRMLEQTHTESGFHFETCAEPALGDSDAIERCGCISAKDLDLMGLPAPDTGVNPQHRHGCLCLSCKHELLSNRKQCPHGCLYCYWRQ